MKGADSARHAKRPAKAKTLDSQQGCGISALAGSPWVVTHPGFPQIRTCALERIRLVRAWVRYKRYSEWTTRAGGSG